MPSTNYTDATMGARIIGARTDAAGVEVTDLSAEEARYDLVVYGEGYLTPANAFLPAGSGGANMNVVIGSGTAKADYYIVAGDIAGQGKYMVRLASATETVTLDAADGSLPRIDQIWLVVMDDAYDASGLALPRFGYRKGDTAASPTAPGADSAWDASVLLAQITVPAGAADITECTVTDHRARSVLSVPGLTLGGGGLAMGGGAITGVGAVDGVDISEHKHSGGADGLAIAASSLTGLQAAVNAADVDAATLDGNAPSAFAAAAHVGAGGGAHADVVASGASGFMTGDDKAKLDSISGGAAGNQTITAGSGIVVTDGSSSTPIVAHADTSSQGSVANGAGTVIEDVTLDGFGHVTALGSRTLTAANIGAAASSHTHSYYSFEGSSPRITISTGSPSGGANGDVWFKY